MSDDWSQARQLLWLLAPLAAVVVAAALVSGPAAALWCAIAVAVAAALLFVGGRRRKAELRQLAAEIDAVLQSGRELRFSDYREGDLAVLRNELEKMVARLARLTEQLSQEKGALADALADISHQIRTPLCAAQLMLPAIERAQDAAERKRLSRELEELLARISWLVATLLKIAKVDAGALAVEHRAQSMESVIERACAPLAVAMDLRDVTLEIECDSRIGFMGDGLWTAEALENIVKNCLEHTPAGGTIRLWAEEDALATRLVVQDSGSGIAPEDLPRLFERFYRGRTAAEGAESGFGVGLSLAQALVAAQGGTLSADNARDGRDGRIVGARFQMSFPKLCV